MLIILGFPFVHVRIIQHTYLMLLGNSLHKETCSDIVDIWYQDRGIFRFGIRWIDVLLHSVPPMLPVA